MPRPVRKAIAMDASEKPQNLLRQVLSTEKLTAI